MSAAAAPDRSAGDWLTEDRPGLQIHRDLTEAASRWQAEDLSAAVGAVAGYRDAVTGRDQAIANQISEAANQLVATNPSLAARFYVAANRSSSTPDSQTRLLNTTATPLSSVLTGPGEVLMRPILRAPPARDLSTSTQTAARTRRSSPLLAPAAPAKRKCAFRLRHRSAGPAVPAH
jgi:hypothetical protein